MTPEEIQRLNDRLETGALRERLDTAIRRAEAAEEHSAALEAELAEARKDGERLSWMIEVSNAGMGWIEDAVWDSAPDIEGCHDVQVLIRAAIDAARGSK